MDGLTPGRVVHYVDSEGNHLAAIVTQVNGGSDKVFLNVQMTWGDPVLRAVLVPFDGEVFNPGTWHWIEPA